MNTLGAKEANRWDGWSLSNDCVHKKGKKEFLEMQFAPGISHVRSDLSPPGYHHCLILYHDQVPLKC